MKYNVLIFPAGAENALEIYDALRYNVNVEVFGASGKKDFAEFKYDSEHYIEEDLYINRDDFVLKMQNIIDIYHIDVIIPTHDDVVLYLTKHRNEFSARILAAEYRTAEICRSKKKMYQLVREEDYCPVVYEPRTSQNFDSVIFPVFVKPDIGAGAVGTKLIDCDEELRRVNWDDYVVCEFLPGTEISVDCFTDRNGELKFIGPRQRNRIQMGIAFRSTTVGADNEIIEIAEDINKKLSFFGAWYFQLRKDKKGKYKLLEISCRQAGTMTLYRHMGINFPMLGIFELMGVNTSYIKLSGNFVVERCLHNSFKYQIEYDTVYIDYDDTIIINNRVCGIIIRFLYQCVNERKKIVLLTRHNGCIEKSLAEFKISLDLFYKINCFGFDKEKVDYINPKDNAIFIDNSFEERKKVNDKLGIPVFDIDMVDLLIKE